MRRTALLLASYLAFVVGCSSGDSAPSASSESAHAEGSFVHVPDGEFVWTAGVPHSELKYRDEDLSKVLPDSDPLPARIQAWADRIDALVRASVNAGGATLRAPKPIIKVLPTDKTFDAWVGSAPACLGVGFDGAASETAPTHVVLGASSMRAVALPPSLTCSRPADWPSNDALLGAWSALEPECDLSLSEEGKLTSTECAAKAAPDTLLVATTPYVHFSTPLLAFMDEKTMVTRLAHELGHYYRAHRSTMVEHKYGYWYDRDPKLPGRPVPAEGQRDLDTLYRGVFAAPKNMTIDGALNHARTHKAIAYLAFLMGKRQDADFVCANAVAKTGPWVVGLVKPDQNGLSEEAKAAYLAFETELAACAPMLKLGAEPSADTFVADQLRLAVDAGGFDPASLGELTTLDAALASLSTAAAAMDVAETEMLDKLREGRIGLYTTEQEADEIALEVVTKLGISAGEVVGGTIKQMALLEKLGAKFAANETGELGAAACQQLLEADFTEAGPDGQPVPVQMTLGDLDNEHHGMCYQVYNLWRENNAHKYETNGAFTPPAGPEWKDLAYEAAKLSGLIDEGSTTPPEATTPPQEVPPSAPSSDDSSDERTGAGSTRWGDRAPSEGGSAKAGADSGCSVARTKGSSTTAGLILAALVFASRRRRRA